jgi:competence protein CoiA
MLRKGTIKIAHFAHVPHVACRFGHPESEEHRRCKLEIYQALSDRADVTRLELERPLGEVRPDISAVIRGVPVAIEVQITVLPIETVIHRTVEYAKRGIALLWISPWTPKLDDYRYSPSFREKWLHAAYFGQAYYWTSGLTVVPYRFEPYPISVPKMEWQDKRGRVTTGGGYSRISKRFRKPVAGEPLHLVDDFGAVDRGPFEAGKLVVPKARLWIGKKR